MKTPLDNALRMRAITERGTTMLVEAAAGTGKTALMAARVTYMLAEGVDPSHIAAITYTEPAASTLAERIQHYIEELLQGERPKPLLAALPDGLSPKQAAQLRHASTRLEALTVTTIHAFCRIIISSYAVEADIDPGARILDADQMEAAISEIFERWLKRRLDGTAPATDVIAVLSRDKPRDVADMLRTLALFRLQHRTAATMPPNLSGRPDVDLTEAVAEFRRWFSGVPEEPLTAGLLEDLEQLTGHFADSFATAPDFGRLWSLAHPPFLKRSMRNKTIDLKEPRLKTAWRKADRQEGENYNAQMMACFERVRDCYREILGRIAGAVVARLAPELDEVVEEYETFKRTAALVDFDGLIERARYLVRTHDDVRRELGARYAHILVDEFQDTDPLQSEILFQIAAETTAPNWIDNVLRPGALFLVGDPKQSVFRFRGADIDAYKLVRRALEGNTRSSIISITANFRSRPRILEHVNACFASVLDADGQPGYVPLTAFLDHPTGNKLAVAKLMVDMPAKAYADDVRDYEAEAVARLCRQLIGRVQVEDADGTKRPLRAGDITLLSPGKAQLWRYETALEDAGLPIASQAGKGLFRRQETQDMLALARLLGDANDTLAFGAFMRGPLVGLSEEVLLDITAALPALASGSARAARFSIRTNPDDVVHTLARETLITLRELRRRARSVTPAILLAEAVERLRIRSILLLREPHTGGRAIANIEAFIERARPYGVRGLKSFVREATRQLSAGHSASEGQLDAESDAINLITLHSAKGLEWPVVIPINMATMPRPLDTFIHRVSDNTLHMTLGDVVPPELVRALEGEERMLRREQERLWYVACTRARELLVVPYLAEAGQRSWARIIDHKFSDLEELDLGSVVAAMPTQDDAGENLQTAEIFEAERAKIAVKAKPIVWLRPSDHDNDRAAVIEAFAAEPGDAPETEAPIGAGRLRGLVLHKLMEEILTGELVEDERLLATRASALTASVAVEEEEGAALPDAGEMARTVIRTLAMKEVAALRPFLVPEWPIYAIVRRHDETALSGRLDAVAIENGRPSVVIDWKSDVDPTSQEIGRHRSQMHDYLSVTGAERGILIYMTSGKLLPVEKPSATG